MAVTMPVEQLLCILWCCKYRVMIIVTVCSNSLLYFVDFVVKVAHYLVGMWLVGCWEGELLLNYT
jgi:hypothetical protein